MRRGLGRRRREIGRVRDLLVGVVPDAEPAAEIGDARDPAELVAARRGKRREPDDRLRLRVEVGELRADVDVETEHVEPALERIRDEGARLAGRKAELRAVVAGADRLVRIGVDAERDADEHPCDSGRGREGCFVGRVENDGGALASRLAQERLVLVVPVDDDLVARQPGGSRERELARRGDVGAEALLAQQPQHGQVREGLRAEDDPAAARGGEHGPRSLAQRLLAVDDERRAEALGELGRRHAAERQRAGRPRRWGNRSSIRRFCLLPSKRMTQLLR